MVQGPEAADSAAAVAVIMTSHNRRSLTVESIRRVLDQEMDRPMDLTIFLADDSSEDGTAEAAAILSERVRVLHGSGALYWAAGMARAESEALSEGFDYLLWLNDDTFLSREAVQTLVRVSEQNPDAIVVGAAREPDSRSVAYGARRRTSSWHPQRFELLPESSGVQEADTFNGNIVLIPRRVHDRIGNIDGEFPHAYADDDYGLRARAAGFRVLQAPGVLGECSRGPSVNPVRGWAAWRAAQDPKGLPWRAQVRFFRRHGGAIWPLTLLAQQVRMVVAWPNSGRGRNEVLDRS
ncbi:MAG: glycosyltransferase family 2 protein [Candidatus Nanopelagicales bacterium]